MLESFENNSKMNAAIFIAVFAAIAVQLEAFHLNHTCYTIKKKGWTPVQTCSDCFHSAYPNEPVDIDQLNDEAKKCVEQLPVDYHKCTSESRGQKTCLEHVSRKFFKTMRDRFWHHYINKLTAAERATVREFVGVIFFLYEIRQNNFQDWVTVNSTMTHCRSELLDNYRRFRRYVENEIRDNEVSEKEAKDEEEEMDEGDYMQHNVKLMEKFTMCMANAFFDDKVAHDVIYRTVENVKCSVPVAIVRTFYTKKP